MFLQHMKHLFFTLLTIILFSSCSEYQKALKNDDIAKKYELGISYYEQAQDGAKRPKAKYRKAIKLFEQILPQYRGKPQGEKLAFVYANSYYELEDYFLSGYQFERFTKAYPDSDRVEEAAFKSARSYYEGSPRYSLDQADTDKALDKLQLYFVTYPEGQFIEEANVMATELGQKLEKKAYEIAKQYHHTENYKPAIEAFDNYLVDYPGSSYREKAIYYKFESAYLLAINSYDYLVEERLLVAKSYLDNYFKYYQDGELSVKANELKADIEARLQEYS